MSGRRADAPYADPTPFQPTLAPLRGATAKKGGARSSAPAPPGQASHTATPAPHLPAATVANSVPLTHSFCCRALTHADEGLLLFCFVRFASVVTAFPGP